MVDTQQAATQTAQPRRRRQVLAYGLFWGWNLIFLAFVLLGFGPTLLPDVVVGVRQGLIPAQYVIYSAILIATPVAAVILGATRLRKEPERLFMLGYCVEGPLMLMLAVRFFLIMDATSAVHALIGLALTGMSAFLWYLLQPNLEKRPAWLLGLRMAGMTVMVLVSLYAAVWVAFYAIPLLVLAFEALKSILENIPRFFRELWRMFWQGGWLWLPFYVLAVILFFFTLALFVMLPVVVPWMVLKAWVGEVRAFGKALALASPSENLSTGRDEPGAARKGLVWAWGLAAAVAILAAAVFGLANRQPQAEAFALLENPPASPAEAQALLAQQEQLRAGLLNAYLAPARYLSSVGEVNHISSMYRDTLGVSKKAADWVQGAYEMVVQPLLYRPVKAAAPGANGRALVDEPRQAAVLYQKFFDRSIGEGERTAIVRAARSTWSPEQAASAWQSVDEREVHLDRQEVTLVEHGDWAEVELYEVYSNRTERRQEVVYYFSLPESAVPTGLWLGYSSDRAQRFEYQIAPRGAAQALYQNEVTQQRDPALLEQIGPRQYRLRAFPVEPGQISRQDEDLYGEYKPAPPLHLWLTYQVLAGSEAGGDGYVFALPQLAEHRNIYWDETTQRVLNGQAWQPKDDEWLPAALPAAGVSDLPQDHRSDFPGGRSVVVQPVPAGWQPAFPAGARLAVVIDRSYSMQPHADQLDAALQQLRDLPGEPQVDLYLTAAEFRGEAPRRVSLADLQPGDPTFFGGQNAAELLAQFDTLRQGQDYDGVFVLTDESGYEMGQGLVELPGLDFPAWLVHLTGKFPPGYDDRTLELVQASGGGAAGSLDEALTRWAAERAGGPEPLDGYLWQVLEAGQAPTEITADAAFGSLGARQLILAQRRALRGQQAPNDVLDQLHALAIENSIVTPYSSMIVLVTDRQRQQLERLEKQADRFQREYEAVGETAPQNPFAVTGVPEPEEWLLLALAGLAAGWMAWRARRMRPVLPQS